MARNISFFIRKYDKDDLSSLIEVYIECFPMFKPEICRETAELYVSASNGLTFVAEVDGKVVGFIIGVRSYFDVFKQLKRNLSYLLPWKLRYILPADLLLATKPYFLVQAIQRKYRGRGAAKLLASELIREFEKRELNDIYFETKKDNFKVHFLYESLGFNKVVSGEKLVLYNKK
jgi:ribosomal protein S18 acetylase RimI-like enzyme